MKVLKRALCVLLAAALLFGCTGCASKKSKAVTVDGQSISAAMYVYQLQQQKTSYLSENSLTETEDMWDNEYDDDYTLGEYLQTLVLDNFISTCLWRNQFEKLGLSFSEEEQKSIDDSIAEMEKAYGGRKLLESALAEYDLSYDEYIQAVYYDAQKILKVVDYYYGENGLEPVDGKQVLDYFKDNYARVKHILISTRDSDGATVTGDDMLKVRKTAQTVYEKAKNADEAAFDKLIEEYNEDEGVSSYPDGYLFTTGEMTSKFESAAFDMEVGETRLIQSEYGFHIMRKLSLEDEDIYTEQVRQKMLLQIKTDSLQKMLTEWREDADIKLNRSVLSKYTCNTVATTSETKTSETDQVEALAESLGLTEEDKVK